MHLTRVCNLEKCDWRRPKFFWMKIVAVHFPPVVWRTSAAEWLAVQRTSKPDYDISHMQKLFQCFHFARENAFQMICHASLVSVHSWVNIPPFVWHNGDVLLNIRSSSLALAFSTFGTNKYAREPHARAHMYVHIASIKIINLIGGGGWVKIANSKSHFPCSKQSVTDKEKGLIDARV